MARRVAALMQGSRRGQDGVIWHGDHAVSKNRRRRNKMPKAPERGSKKNQWTKDMQKLQKQMAWKSRRFREWEKAHPDRPRRENPYALPRKEFKTNAFAEAFAAAGIEVPRETHEQQ